MSTNASNGHFGGFVCKSVVAGVAAALCAGVALWVMNAPASAQDKVPQLMSSTVGWISQGGFLDPPAGTRHGPIKQHPAYPFHGNLDGPGQVTPAIGNWEDPALKPWVAASMKKSNEEVLSGERSLAFTAQSRCHPGGVPGQLLYPIEPMYFVQKPKQVWMIWQRDHMVRRVYLTEHHSEVVKPSWFGESIGRFENGEFVVDTVGLQTKNSYIDNYRTPHSEKLHVVERYKVVANGDRLEAAIKIEDPDAFNEPLYMLKRWRKAGNPFIETVCSENNADFFYQNLVPIPQAATPDF